MGCGNDQRSRRRMIRSKSAHVSKPWMQGAFPRPSSISVRNHCFLAGNPAKTSNLRLMTEPDT